MKKNIFNISIGMMFVLLAILLFEHEDIDSLEMFHDGYGILKLTMILTYMLIGQIGSVLLFFIVGILLITYGILNLVLKKSSNLQNDIKLILVRLSEF